MRARMPLLLLLPFALQGIARATQLLRGMYASETERRYRCAYDVAPRQVTRQGVFFFLLLFLQLCAALPSACFYGG